MKFYVLQFESGDDMDLNHVFSEEGRRKDLRWHAKLNDTASYEHLPDITNGMFCTLVYVEGMTGVKNLIRLAREKDWGMSYIVYEMKEVKIRV
jgi:hypothetical protein